MYQVLFAKKSLKELEKLPREYAKSTKDKIDLLSFPFKPFLDIKSLAGMANFYRLRVGRIRVIFEVDHNNNEIWIRRVGFRENIYNLL